MKQCLNLRGWFARSALLAGLGLALAAPAAAQVDWSSLSLQFTQPTGLVGPNDSIDVHVRLSNNDLTDSFTVDSSLPFGGLQEAQLPTIGYGTDPQGNAIERPFASYTGFNLGLGFGCSGSFTSSCIDGPPYSFSFAANPFDMPYVLAAGAHHDYLMGTFTPSAGPVAAGDYYFYRSTIFLNVYGLDADGNSLWGYAFPASTCLFTSPSECQTESYFTRTVGAVPEPESYALMFAGLGLLALRLRSRRRH